MDRDVVALGHRLERVSGEIASLSEELQGDVSEDVREVLRELRFDALESAQRLLLAITGMLASDVTDEVDEIHKRKDESAFMEGELNDVKKEEVEGHGVEAD